MKTAVPPYRSRISRRDRESFFILVIGAKAEDWLGMNGEYGEYGVFAWVHDEKPFR